MDNSTEVNTTEGTIKISSPSLASKLNLKAEPEQGTIEISSPSIASELKVKATPEQGVINVSTPNAPAIIKVKDSPSNKTLKLSAGDTTTSIEIGNAGSTRGSIKISPVYVSDMTIEVDSTITVPYGEDAYVLNLGDTKHAKLQFGLPNGNGIEKIELVEETLLRNKYRITFQNGNTFDYYVNNGTGVSVWGAISGNILDQTDLVTLLNNLQANINTEATTRANADTTLQGHIDALTLSLETEAVTRANADSALQTSLANEVTARTNADTTLQANITAEATARANADTAETTARTNADTALQANITAEETARTEADTVLENAITTEATTRATADEEIQTALDTHTANKSNPHEVTKAQVGLGNVDNTSDLNKPISTATQTALNAETTARTSADTTLQTNINTEATTRASADTALQEQIDTQELKFDDYRKATDQDVIDSGLQSSISANTSSINTINNTLNTYGNIVTHNVSEFATSAQGAKADTAIQPNDNITKLTNNAGFITKSVNNLDNYTKTTDLGDLAFKDTVNYETEVTNKPTIPTVNNNTVTVKEGNVTKGTFTLNQNTDKTINLTSPATTLSYSDPTLTLKNADGTTLSSVTIKSSPDVDNQTIYLNANEALEARGVHTKDGSVKYNWIGTNEEYQEAWEAGEIGSGWFCYITDDEQDLVTYEGGTPTDVYTKAEVDQLLLLKQNVLTAGQNITIIDNVISAQGGGPVTPNFELTVVTPLVQTIAYGSSLNLIFGYNSFLNLKASAVYKVNGVQKGTKVITTNGQVEYAIGEYLVQGENTVEVTVTDVYGFSMTQTYTITSILLTIESNFDSSQFYSSDITFRYTPYGNVSKTIHYVLDNVETTEVITTSGRPVTKLLNNLTYGVHSLSVYSTATVSGTTITSNVLYYEIIYIGGTQGNPIIASEFTGTTYKQGELVSIPFTVYTPDQLTSEVNVYVNNVLTSQLSVGRTLQTWSKNITTSGAVAIKFVSGATERTFNITVTPVQIDVQPVTENLILYLDAAGRSNSDVNREHWDYNDIHCTLTNFNFVNNGWLHNSLVISNGASVTIPLKIFEQDFRQGGKTIEIEFATSNIADYDSIVASCLSGGRGLQIGVQNAFLKSEQSEVSVSFKEDEHIRLSFVVEPSSVNRLIYTYLNGILSGVAQYPSDDDFSQISPVNVTLGSDTAEIHVYKIRVYNANLTMHETLNNWIADTNDINDKINRYTRNQIYDAYGNIVFNSILNQVPVMTITGDLPPVKGDKKKVHVNYQDLTDPTRNFDMSNVTFDIQGTSSQYYPKKNYKLSKMPEAHSLRQGSVAEKAFTLKADYMESSHAHNTGLGKFVASLYTDQTPPQVEHSNIRTTIDGFPIAMFYRENDSVTPYYFGVYNFNNDKENNNTWGFTDGCESWGVENNTSNRCLFLSDDFTDTEAVLTDFEPRYPADYTNINNLHALVSWVVACDSNKATGNAITPVTIGGVTYDHDTVAYRIAKFKDECDEHFNVNYLLTYYIVGEFFGMVDSFAKNLFLNRYANGIWYPVFYDMDTQCGLNNEGVNDFNFNIEFHDQIGTSKVFNGESSALWAMVERAYPDEIQALYQSLRSSDRLSYDKVMAVYEGEQIGKICEAQYNEDAQFKYLNPLIEEGTATYLYTAQGSRIDHIKWWLSSRFKYMDSKYIASDYQSNYLTMRIYTPQTWHEVQPSAVITVTPYADQYVRIKYGSYTVGGRAQHDVPYVVTPPAGITFNDTETILYGADKITSIGDLSPLYAGTIDVSKAIKISELTIGHGGEYENTNLRSLTLGNNTLLQVLDVRNCPNLTGALDISGCTNIREVDTTGTSITSLKLPNAGSITDLLLPNTITNLTIKNQNSIENFSCGYNTVQTLVLENINLDSKAIFNSCVNLTKVRIVGIDWTLGNSFALLDRIYNMLGVDEQGYNLDHGVLTGTVRMSNVRDSEVNEYRAKFTGVTFIVDSYLDEDFIFDDFGDVITTAEGYPLLYTTLN